MTRAVRLRLFLDSNVLTGGILAPSGLDKGVLSLCAARICRMVLAEVVRQEVETNLRRERYDFGTRKPGQLDIVVDTTEAARSRALIRHEADVPVLLSAIQESSRLGSHPQPQAFFSRGGREDRTAD